MAVRRDPPQDVQWRAGHTTSTMTEQYITNARYEAGATFGTRCPSCPRACSFPRPRPTSLPSPRREEKYWYGFRVSVEKDPKNIEKTVEAPGIVFHGKTSISRRILQFDAPFLESFWRVQGPTGQTEDTNLATSRPVNPGASGDDR